MKVRLFYLLTALLFLLIGIVAIVSGVLSNDTTAYVLAATLLTLSLLFFLLRFGQKVQ